MHLTVAEKKKNTSRAMSERERESPFQCALCEMNCMELSMQIHPSSTDKEPCMQTSAYHVYKAQCGQRQLSA